MSTPENEKKLRRRMPGWLRALLFIALFVFVALAYYLNFQDIIDKMRD